jgi:regulator of replication initiation timing
MVAATEAGLDAWRLLQELAGIKSSLAESISTRVKQELAAETERLRDQLAAQVKEKAEVERSAFESSIHLQLTEELLTLSAYGPGTDNASRRLADLSAAGDNSFPDETT